MSKKRIALIINIAIVILEVIVFGSNIINDHGIAIQYYTNDSNILALISSLLFIVLYRKNWKYLKDFRFATTCCLIVTFLTVLFILGPMDHFNYKLYMFTDNFLILHTIVPILSAISYIFFEEKSGKAYLCLLLTIIYSIVLVILNILNIVQGPYPFLMVTKQSVLETIIWAVIILGGSYIIGLILNLISRKKGANDV